MAKKKNAEYHRFDKAERVVIEHRLKKGCSCREIARELGRSPSSVYCEVRNNRTIEKGANKGMRVDEIPDEVCPKLERWPYVCNGCKQWHYHCSRKFKVEYCSVCAQKLAEDLKKTSRMGVDRDRAEFERIMDLIRDDLSRGLSPSQIVMARKEEVGADPSTIYRWIERGYAGMNCMDLRRRCGYKKRHHKVEPKPTAHGENRAYAAFSALEGEVRAGACEMDTVIGRSTDSQCLLTLYLRPCKFQFALLMPDKSKNSCQEMFDKLEKILGFRAFSEMFGLILTDNGSEFYDFEGLERSVENENEKRCSIYYCDVRQSQQKGSCERNHVELRKILPKRLSINFDRLNCEDCSVLMSNLNSEPRKSLGQKCAIDLFLAIYGEKAQLLLDAFNVKKVKYDNLIMLPKVLEIERQKRGAETLLI